MELLFQFIIFALAIFYIPIWGGVEIGINYGHAYGISFMVTWYLFLVFIAFISITK